MTRRGTTARSTGRARIERELPVLIDLFGPPGRGGLLDAGCGTGRHAEALAQRGYRVVAADVSTAMLDAARTRSLPESVRLVEASFGELSDRAGVGFDALYCLGNSLPAAGSRAHVIEAIFQFAKCLRAGGRLFLQVLNFPPMRNEAPCIRGPRVSTVDGIEYLSVRQFHFVDDLAELANITLWREAGSWKQRSHRGWLYPVDHAELTEQLTSAGLRVEAAWSGYDRKPFVPDLPTDLLMLATKA